MTSQGFAETAQRLAPLCLRYLAPDRLPKFIEVLTILNEAEYTIGCVIIGLIALIPFDMYMDNGHIPLHCSLIFVCVAIRQAIIYLFKSTTAYVRTQYILLGNAQAFA